MRRPRFPVTKNPLVLVIDDEISFQRLMKKELCAQGFDVEVAGTADAGLSLAASLRPEAVFLDLGLPDRDGLVLLHELRDQLPVPVIVLSARGNERDKVLALNSGADDYLTKPFSLVELVARLRAVLRRAGSSAARIDRAQSFGELTWDSGARRVFIRDVEVHLTPVEYRLFVAFASHPGRILTHRWLLQEVWGRQTDEYLHYVRIAVAGLRKKLENDSSRETSFFHTEVGVGYRFFDRGEASSS